MFYKKGVLRNFAKFTGKHLCWSLFFDKVAGLPKAELSFHTNREVFNYKDRPHDQGGSHTHICSEIVLCQGYFLGNSFLCHSPRNSKLFWPQHSSGALKEQNLIERSVKVSNNNGVWSAILPTLLLLIKYFLHISCINEIWSKLIINTSEECHGSDFCYALFEVLLLFWPYLYFLHF